MTLTELRVADVMLRDPKTLPAGTTAAEARRALEKPSVQILLLVDGERFLGPVTAIPDDAHADDPAIAFLDPSAPTASQETPVSDALELLDDKPHGRLVVLDGARLVGLVCLNSDGTGFCGVSATPF